MSPPEFDNINEKCEIWSLCNECTRLASSSAMLYVIQQRIDFNRLLYVLHNSNHDLSGNMILSHTSNSLSNRVLDYRLVPFLFGL